MNRFISPIALVVRRTSFPRVSQIFPITLALFSRPLKYYYGIPGTCIMGNILHAFTICKFAVGNLFTGLMGS